MIYCKDRSKYKFKNKFCPICGKFVDSYRYRFKDGMKICIEHYVKPKKVMVKENIVLMRREEDDRLLSLS